MGKKRKLTDNDGNELRGWRLFSAIMALFVGSAVVACVVGLVVFAGAIAAIEGVRDWWMSLEWVTGP